MENHFQLDLAAEAERLFDESSRTNIDPRAVIISGGVAAGKTTLRVRDYSRGFVLIDAAEMFHHFCRGDEGVDFPGPFADALERVGRTVARRALSERRNIVTEVIGADVDEAKRLIEALKSVGYRIEIKGVTCEVNEALRRNRDRGDSVSAYYAERFQRAWLIDACAELLGSREGAATRFMRRIKKAITPKSATHDQAAAPLLAFKDGNAAFEYACRFLTSPDPQNGITLPAVVLDARQQMGTQEAVKTKPDGNQIALLRVVSGDGGFLVLAETVGPNGPRLDPGQLVVWRAQQYVATIATHATDKRFGWVGLIMGTLKPEHRDEAWVGDKRFLS